MALAFSLTLPTDTTFISVGDIPELTAGAIYSPSDSQPESNDSGLDLHELKYAVCQTEHAKTLDMAIDERMVTLLNPLSFVGRAPQQVSEFLEEIVAPIRSRYRTRHVVRSELTV